jgi:hypothetical protein
MWRVYEQILCHLISSSAVFRKMMISHRTAENLSPSREHSVATHTPLTLRTAESIVQLNGSGIEP